MDFIRFHSLLSNADPTVQALNLVEAEINAIYASTNALLALEMESKLAVLNGLLRGEGEIEGVPCATTHFIVSRECVLTA